MALLVTRQAIEAVCRATNPLPAGLHITRQAVEVLVQPCISPATESLLAMASAAGCTISRVVTASSELGLTYEASTSDHVITQVDAHSVCAVQVSASVSSVRMLTAASTLALIAEVRCNLPVAVAANSILTLTHEATATKGISTVADAWDWIPLWVTSDVRVARTLAAESVVAMSQAILVGRPWRLAAASVLQTIRQEYDPQVDEIVKRIEGLQGEANAVRPHSAALRQPIPLHQSAAVVRVKATAIDVAAENAIELLGSIHRNQTGAARDWLVFAQTAAVDPCRPAGSALDLHNTAAVLLSVPRAAGSVLGLKQAAAYSIVLGGVLQKYHPFVGAGEAGSPMPPPVIPPEGTVAAFRLFYPATGVVTDSVTLRAPNFGNKDRLSFQRILRETRGGTLVVFADPIWPKIQTLILTFSGLQTLQAQQLLSFLDAHLGEEVGLLDWEGRCWRGVITTPAEPVVQDSRDSYSASLEFEGELVPT